MGTRAALAIAATLIVAGAIGMAVQPTARAGGGAVAEDGRLTARPVAQGGNPTVAQAAIEWFMGD